MHHHRKPPSRMRGVAAVAAAVAAAFGGAFAATDGGGARLPFAEYEVPRPFSGRTQGAVADELSGIACRTAAADGSGGLFCVVVDNETTFAQAAVVEPGGGGRKGRIAPLAGAPLALVGAAPPPGAVGTDPEAPCPGGRERYREFDGEGVAYDGARFYVVGSHGCTRGKAEFRGSMFLLVRMRVDGRGQPQDQQSTFRLSEVLRKHPEVGAHFAKALKDAQGLNIEGIAAVGDRLYFGLRAPSRGTDAVLLGVRAEDLFRPAAEVPEIAASSSRVGLGEGAGIRDLSVLPDGRLLVLSGPAQDRPGVPYALWAVPVPPAGEAGVRLEPQPLGCLARPSAGAGNPEAVAVVSADGDALRVLVLHDGAANGGPREYRVPLRGAPC